MSDFFWPLEGVGVSVLFLIVYNSIRLLMLNAAKQANESQRRISFKASVQALRQWEPMLNRADLERMLLPEHSSSLGMCM